MTDFVDGTTVLDSAGNVVGILDGATGNVVDSAGNVIGALNPLTGQVLDAAGNLVGTVGQVLDDVTDTLDQLDTGDLLKGDLLNVDVNVDLDADLAAPINGAVAANANVAAPIDAAVAANILSENSEATAIAQQDAIITQSITGSAEATSDQISTIDQSSVEPSTPTPRRRDGTTRRSATATTRRASRRRRPRTDSGARGDRHRPRRAATPSSRHRDGRPALRRPDRRRDRRHAVTTLVDAPARVDGVQLIGEMVGSGYRTPPALVRRGDGQVLQLTPLLYLVLRRVDGRRSCAEIAEPWSEPQLGRQRDRGPTSGPWSTATCGRSACSRAPTARSPSSSASNPLLGLKPRVAVTDPRTTHRLTDPFRVLFRPRRRRGGRRSASSPWSAGSSSSGASARRRTTRSSGRTCCCSSSSCRCSRVASTSSGTPPRPATAVRSPASMGAGLYLVWPAFYTDVTDSYRLGRAGRIRTDLGGLYFNAIVVVLTFVWWWATGWEALLLLVATQVLQMVQQLLPLLRFDGYHLLADLAGVPDLYQRIRPTLLGLLPHRWNGAGEPRAHAVGARR